MITGGKSFKMELALAQRCSKGEITDDMRAAIFRISTYAQAPLIWHDFPLLARLEVIKTILDFGDRPFYVDEVFPNADRVDRRGGYMSGLSQHLIIKHTGNWSVTEQPKGQIAVRKEWKLALPHESFQKAYETYKAFVFNNL